MTVESRYWFGKFLDDTLFVYDEALQPPPRLRDKDLVSVFLFPEIKIRDFCRSNLRRIARRANQIESEDAMRAYSTWKSEHLSTRVLAFDKIESERAARVSAFNQAESERIERTKNDRLEKHRAFLVRSGVETAGTRPRPIGKPKRHTICYACHEELDSTIEFECVACGWLVCQCGACGCGYSP